jgi:hypothetical protein
MLVFPGNFRSHTIADPYFGEPNFVDKKSINRNNSYLQRQTTDQGQYDEI